MSNVNNKFAVKEHGRMLSEIAKELQTYLPPRNNYTLVRERGFYFRAHESQVLSKVVGIADLYAWENGKKTFLELSPKTIKKLVTGNASASKEEVATALTNYVGPLHYACDDESDAVAVGVAWLLENKYIDQKE